MHKGVEQPQVIVYVLFVVVLTLAGIYVAFTQLGGVNITFKFQDYASRLNTVSAKLMLTPECYAVENSYSKSGYGTYYQVSGGVIDWVKFNKSSTISGDCMADENQVLANLTEINGNYYSTAWTGRKPSTEQLNKDWAQLARSYFVLIKNGSQINQGILTVRLKE